MSTDFPIGVNYWPAELAMDWWTDVRAELVDRDFSRIADADLNAVRFFLRWQDFQPEPGRVDATALANLRAVADIAADHSLRIIPTLFCGHMSAANWLPRWMLTNSVVPARVAHVCEGSRLEMVRSRDWWSDIEVRDSQELWAREAAEALCGHSALWAWDLGNENSNCWLPQSRDDGRRWLDVMTGAIRSADPNTLVTIGTHMEDLEEDRHIRPREAAEMCDFLCMHGYPIYCDWASDFYDAWLCPFLCVITRWLGGKGVLFEEYGAPTLSDDDPEAREATAAGIIVMLEEEPVAQYISAVTGNLRRVGATGALLWCCADYSPQIWDRPPLAWAVHERHFGLWRHDGSPKPAVAALQQAIADGRTISADCANTDWIDLTPEEFWGDPHQQLARLYHRFRGSLS